MPPAQPGNPFAPQGHTQNPYGQPATPTPSTGFNQGGNPGQGASFGQPGNFGQTTNFSTSSPQGFGGGQGYGQPPIDPTGYGAGGGWYGQLPNQPQKINGLTLAGIITGGTAVVVGFAPVVGLPIGVLGGIFAVVVGILGLTKKQGTLSIITTALGGVAIVVSLIMSLVVYHTFSSDNAAPDAGASSTSASPTSSSPSTSHNPVTSTPSTRKTGPTPAPVPGGDPYEGNGQRVTVAVGALDANTEQQYAQVPVTVSNLGTTQTTVFITLVAKDAAGVEVARDIVISFVAPTGTDTTTAFTETAVADYPKLRAATFSIESVRGI